MKTFTFLCISQAPHAQVLSNLLNLVLSKVQGIVRDTIHSQHTHTPTEHDQVTFFSLCCCSNVIFFFFFFIAALLFTTAAVSPGTSA